MEQTCPHSRPHSSVHPCRGWRTWSRSAVRSCDRWSSPRAMWSLRTPTSSCLTERKSDDRRRGEGWKIMTKSRGRIIFSVEIEYFTVIERIAQLHRRIKVMFLAPHFFPTACNWQQALYKEIMPFFPLCPQQIHLPSLGCWVYLLCWLVYSMVMLWFVWCWHSVQLLSVHC